MCWLISCNKASKFTVVSALYFVHKCISSFGIRIRKAIISSVCGRVRDYFDWPRLKAGEDAADESDDNEERRGNKCSARIYYV